MKPGGARSDLEMRHSFGINGSLPCFLNRDFLMRSTKTQKASGASVAAVPIPGDCSCRCSRKLLTSNFPGRIDRSGGVPEIMPELFFMLQDLAEFLNDPQQLIGIFRFESGAAQFSPVLPPLFSHGYFLRQSASWVVLRTLP